MAGMHTAYYCQPADRIQLPEPWPLEHWVMAVPLHGSVARPALIGYAGARIGVEWSAWFCIAVLCGPGATLSAGVFAGQLLGVEWDGLVAWLRALRSTHRNSGPPPRVLPG